MPVTSARRTTTSTTSSGLSPFIGGSTASSTLYRRSTALSPSRFTTSSTAGGSSGYYRSLSNTSAYYPSSYRNSYGASLSSTTSSSVYSSSYESSRYSSTTTPGGGEGGSSTIFISTTCSYPSTGGVSSYTSSSTGGGTRVSSRPSLDRDLFVSAPSSSSTHTSPYTTRTYRGVSLTNTTSEDHNHNKTSSLKPPPGASGSSSSSSSSSSSKSKPLTATSIATSGADLYEKYSPANYIPKCELSRSRSLSDAAAAKEHRESGSRSGVASRAEAADEGEDTEDRLNNNHPNNSSSSSSGSKYSSKSRLAGSLGSGSSGGAALGGGTVPKVTDLLLSHAYSSSAADHSVRTTAIVNGGKPSNSNTVINCCINNNNFGTNHQHPCDKHNNPSISTRNHITKIQIKGADNDGFSDDFPNNRVISHNNNCTSQNRAVVCVLGAVGSTLLSESTTKGSSVPRGTVANLKATGTARKIIHGNSKLGHDHYGGASAIRRKTDEFLKKECDLTRNELMQRKIVENNYQTTVGKDCSRLTKEEVNNNKIVIEVSKDHHAEINNNNNYQKTVDRALRPISTMAHVKSHHNGYKNELEEVRSAILKGTKHLNHNNTINGEQMEMEEDEVEVRSFKPVTNGKKSAPSSTSSSSTSSIMDTAEHNPHNGKNLEEEIKFIDADDNNETASSYSSKLNRLNKNVASTLDALKTATPIKSALKTITQQHGHHTLPHNSVPNYSEYSHSKKYSTLSNLPSKIRNGLFNGFEDRNGYTQKSYSNEALPGQHEKLKENLTAIINSSEPPNDKISGKSWEINNGTSGRSSSLRNALPPVSPLRSYEPRYRGLIDTEPASSSSGTYGKSSASSDPYDKGTSDSSDGLCGLRNIGNTCFMNSVIQCLSHTSDLTKFLKAMRDPKSTTKDQRILSEFVKLIKEMWSGSTRSVTPMELKSAVSSKHRMYSGCGQQDAQEFLRFFLEALHSGCNEGTKQEGLILDDNMSDNKKADLMWDWYSKTEHSKIKDLFVGQLRSTLKCTVCGNTSVTFDPFWDLSLPLPSSSRCKLENCLELFIKEEVLEGDETPTCSKCQKRQKSTKSFTIQRFPKYLVVHLKRFSETRWSKLTNVVEFPTGERDLNLAPYASSSNTSTSPHYTLYAISNHMGSTAGGHYVALCKHPQSRKWHDFNDNLVSDISESSLISSSAYLLFYERA